MQAERLPIPQLDKHYLHYTSREAAQSIMATGSVKPGRSGNVYLTKDLYVSGADAADHLAIVAKAVEAACLIPVDRVPGIVGPMPVEPIQDADGNPLRHGGGVEFTVSVAVQSPAQRAAWLTLQEI